MINYNNEGGGYFERSNNQWTIRGITSASLYSEGNCDDSKCSIFTNVGEFYDWIEKIVASTDCVSEKRFVHK